MIIDRLLVFLSYLYYSIKEEEFYMFYWVVVRMKLFCVGKVYGIELVLYKYIRVVY